MDNHGITIVVAAGNAQMDACQITPANVNGTISVAGSDMADKFGAGSSDFLYEYDNTGSCVDIFAPGVDIMAACGGAGELYTSSPHLYSCMQMIVREFQTWGVVRNLQIWEIARR